MLRSIMSRNSNTSETAHLVRAMSASHMSPAEVATVDDMQKKGMVASAIIAKLQKGRKKAGGKPGPLDPSSPPSPPLLAVAADMLPRPRMIHETWIWATSGPGGVNSGEPAPNST